VSLVKDLRRDPIVLRDSYATVAIEKAVVDGIRRHGDKFVLVVEPPEGLDGSSSADVVAHAAPVGPEPGGRRPGSPADDVVVAPGAASIPVQGQPTSEPVGRPRDPRD
jgi:hypothetical protein